MAKHDTPTRIIRAETPPADYPRRWADQAPPAQAATASTESATSMPVAPPVAATISAASPGTCTCTCTCTCNGTHGSGSTADGKRHPVPGADCRG
jgi:hypothetical protein